MQVGEALITLQNLTHRVAASFNVRLGSHRDWKTWVVKMVMEKSWNIKKWQKVMEFCDHGSNFAPESYQICVLFADITLVSIGLESSHFLTNSAKGCEC